ncbi:MAG: SGNH/GDSL hydrolase family protein [Bacteroidota bacterium]
MKYILLVVILGVVGCQSSSDTFYTDLSKGSLPEAWETTSLWKDTAQEIATYNPSSSAVVIQQGRLESPAFSVSSLQYYRVQMRVKAPAKAMWAFTFYDNAGEVLLADHYSSIDPSDDFQQYEYYVQSKANAAQAEFWLQPATGQSVSLSEVRVTPAQSSLEVKQWIDSVYQTIPPVSYTPPPGRFQYLDKTMAALRNGEKIRVVMLGNSIINDTGNSAWELLVEEMYPGADLEVITSVRGGTGCTYYQHNNRVDTFVVQYQPDLLMIGGISHGKDTAAMHSVIRQVREWMEPAPEIMVMSGPVGRGGDPRTNPEFSVEPLEGDFRLELAQMTADAQVNYFDMKSAWGAYLEQTQQPYDYFLRDPVHANARGRQILARLLEVYFKPTSGNTATKESSQTELE